MTARAGRGARRRLRARGGEQGGDCARGTGSEEATAATARAGRGARKRLRARGGERGGNCARGAGSEAETARAGRGARRRLRSHGRKHWRLQRLLVYEVCDDSSGEST
jgi:hypothetical protein